MRSSNHNLISLDLEQAIWEKVYTVSPLVVIGTQEGKGFDLAPKHMAFPMGWDNYFGFVCTPRHATYSNAQQEGYFTVSYPRPEDTVMASLAAMPREEKGTKEILNLLPTQRLGKRNGIYLQDAYLLLDCKLEKIIDGFGENSLITGRITEAFIDPDFMRLSERDDGDMLYQHPLLAYLYPGRFAEIRETRAFPFPAHFKK